MTRFRPLQSKHLREIKEAVWNIPSCDDYYLVVLIESGFRPFLFRLAEYVWLIGLLASGSQKASSMTIGLNQLRYDLWLSYLEYIHVVPRLSSVLRSCERIHAAKASAEWYLNFRGFNKDTDQSVSRLYTGRRNHYYDGLFSESRKFIQKRHG